MLRKIEAEDHRISPSPETVNFYHVFFYRIYAIWFPFNGKFLAAMRFKIVNLFFSKGLSFLSCLHHTPKNMD